MAVFQSPNEEVNMKEINQVVYIVKTGTVLPETQWSEEIIIGSSQATLTRKGGAEVNTGTWMTPV